jgi:hypothetical protein
MSRLLHGRSWSWPRHAGGGAKGGKVTGLTSRPRSWWSVAWRAEEADAWRGLTKQDAKVETAAVHC